MPAPSDLPRSRKATEPAVGAAVRDEEAVKGSYNGALSLVPETLPLTPQASSSPRPVSEALPAIGASTALVTSGAADPLRLSMWPAKGRTARQPRQRVAKDARAPLALQLEAFVRKEHRQYLLENPDCARVDTLHIFREAFTVLVDHFTEYKSVLNLIRDEYDSALDEMMEQMKRMRVADLENKSDRSLHAMELIQLKESLNATISNQQAQLKATQGLLHALREQLAAAEHANSLLRYDMERRLKEDDDTKEQVKLLSKALVEESARSASVMAESQRKEKELNLMTARLKVMKENVTELEACLRVQTERNWQTEDGLFPQNTAGSSQADGATRKFSRTRSVAVVSSAASTETRKGEVVVPPITSDGFCSRERVVQLLATIDKLDYELAVAQDRQAARRTPSTVSDTAGGAVAAAASEAPGAAASRTAKVVGDELRVIREWLRQEGIRESDVADTDYLIPPGEWPTEELAFLRACLPVPNRHLSLSDVLAMIEEFWVAREGNIDHTRLPEFFFDWLAFRTGGGAALKELGVNFLQMCQRNTHHPECRALLLLLRGFLPEQMVLTWRRQLTDLRDTCRSTAAAVTGSENTLSTEDFFTFIRDTWPGKLRSHFLQLRFFVWRASGCADEANETVDWAALLSEDSHFVTLLKSQMMREVEEFTLRVVEGVRTAGDKSKNVVAVSRVLAVFRELDSGIDNDTLYTFVTEAAQKSMIDIASADSGAPLSVRLDTMLNRFRSVVLLRRSTPEDIR